MSNNSISDKLAGYVLKNVAKRDDFAPALAAWKADTISAIMNGIANEYNESASYSTFRSGYRFGLGKVRALACAELDEFCEDCGFTVGGEFYASLFSSLENLINAKDAEIISEANELLCGVPKWLGNDDF